MNLERLAGEYVHFQHSASCLIGREYKDRTAVDFAVEPARLSHFGDLQGCREVVVCPHCSISLTYHAANGRLVCHYCGYSTPVTDVCPHCHEPKVDYLGAGTQRAEEELAALLPEARVLRIDTDAAMTRVAYEKRMQDFADGKYDILIGTQMVAKGLDFPNVTLVGVLSADQALYSDDFGARSARLIYLRRSLGGPDAARFAGKR